MLLLKYACVQTRQCVYRYCTRRRITIYAIRTANDWMSKILNTKILNMKLCQNLEHSKSWTSNPRTKIIFTVKILNNNIFTVNILKKIIFKFGCKNLARSIKGMSFYVFQSFIHLPFKRWMAPAAGTTVDYRDSRSNMILFILRRQRRFAKL